MPKLFKFKNLLYVFAITFFSISLTASCVPSNYSASTRILYSQSCASCHDTGANAAPILGDKGAWKPRLVKDKEELYKNAISGFNDMPAQGGNPLLSVKQVEEIVDYMIKYSE